MDSKYLTHMNILYSINNKKDNKDKKIPVAAFDLDHTLIKPKNGRTHPKDKDDFMLFDSKVIELLKEYYNKNYEIVIFSNQDNLIEKPEKKEIVLNRIDTLRKMLVKDNIDLNVFISTGRDFCRKPNTGMWNYFIKKVNYEVDLKKSFYVGDAAGRLKDKKNKKDFSCSDRMFASNIGINFYTPEVFFLKEKDREYTMPNLAQELFVDNEDKNPDIKDLIKYSVIILVGAPASGKSTLSKKLGSGYTILNNDEIKSKSKLKKRLEENCKLQKKIIIDNTNSKVSNRKEYLDIINKYYKKTDICCIIMNINKDQSFFLNNFRCKINKEPRLPDVVIHSYFKYYEEPLITEGFDKIFKWNFIIKFKNEKEKSLFYQYF